jgi:hypothetical protein
MQIRDRSFARNLLIGGCSIVVGLIAGEISGGRFVALGAFAIGGIELVVGTLQFFTELSRRAAQKPPPYRFRAATTVRLRRGSAAIAARERRATRNSAVAAVSTRLAPHHRERRRMKHARLHLRAAREHRRAAFLVNEDDRRSVDRTA